MPADLLTFSGSDVEPVDSPSWQRATPIQRRAYYNRLGWLLRDELDSMLAAGRGFDGRFLTARKRPRRDGASGPPVTPHRADSRGRRLLTHYPTADGVRLNWRASGRLSWRMVMEAHTEGAGNLPVRKVAGLAKARVDRAVAKVRREWLDLHPWERWTGPGGGPPTAPVVPLRRPFHPVPFSPFVPAARPRA